ncbi:MAG TPA: amidohydrolase [Vicinamibacteria bacterium]|jgi:predicted amidohydrolase YtcJ|nr:amidohydrolase [Vicinamibacteria bacterium]
MRHDALIVLFLGFAATAGAGEKADRIFVNGRIWTGDEAHPRVEAVAVRGTTILAVGTTQEIRRLAEKATEVVDLKGRFACPGFNDAHLHFMSGSLGLDELDLAGAAGGEEVQRRLAAYARVHPDRLWFVGQGWAYGDFPEAPHKRFLDAVVSDHPVWLRDRDGHSGWANSIALLLAGIDRRTRDPEHGQIVRDSGGEPTGLLKEGAMELVRRKVPTPGTEDKYRALRKGLDLAISYGLTSVQDASFDEDDLPVFDRVLREGGLKLRVYGALPLVKDPTPDSLAHYRELQAQNQSPRLRLGAVKGFLDGVVDAKTAALFEPYAGGGTGIVNWTQEDLNRAAAFYDKERFQIELHAVGDKAIRMALDAYAYAAQVNGPRTRRHRIEHAEVPTGEDRARFKALGVVASTQPLFANPGRTTLQNYAVLLGPERAAQANAFRLWDEAGVAQAFGSDWPVFSCDVLKGIYCAVTRMTPEGTPAGGFQPQNRISAEAALRHFTKDAAYACLEETLKGTLSAGKVADLVVLSEDILAVPPERILTAKVLLTVLGGQDTYRAKEF